MSKYLGKLLNRASASARAFRDEQSGVAAVEFVFIAPLMILLWLGTMEISQGVEINKKVGRSASIIGDLIAQELSWPVGAIDDIMNIGAAVLLPYKRDAPMITVTEVHIDASLKATVAWSRRRNDTFYSQPFVAGSTVTDLPANLKIADTDVLRVETQLEYLPVTSYAIRKNATGPKGAYATVNMVETYYMRPRNGPSVACVGC